MSRKRSTPATSSRKKASPAKKAQNTAAMSATASRPGPSPAGASTPQRPAQLPPTQDPPVQPPPGLDDAKHAAAQRAAHRAEVLRKGVFPALMADALRLDGLGFDGPAYQTFLEQLLEDAGNPSDPIERMLIEQLAMAHYRIGQLYSAGAHAKTVEAAKVFNSVAARMLGEFRRTALAIRAYRTREPEAKPEARKLKIYKLAQ